MIFLRSVVLLCILILFHGAAFKEKSPGSSSQEICISAQELKLYNLINDYRKQKKLPRIPLSRSLTLVAKTHSKDLAENDLIKGNCNAHSWSDKGKWTSCCYTPDHKQKECMWNKPQELTTYTSTGYEIAFYSSAGASPEQALASWKNSKGHNALIINDTGWKDFQWNAIGIGIHKNFATVWFGADPDAEGEPARCK